MRHRHQNGRVRRAEAGTRARITDTRKTTPGLRVLERYAVRCGGGANHRFSLSDAVMAKDNHLAVLTGGDPAKLTAALRGAKAQLGHTTHFEVEVDTMEQIEPVLAAGVDTIMLDNFSLAELAAGVGLVGGRARVEASGNVNLETVADIAATGVDVISIGALTHSVTALDLGLDIELDVEPAVDSGAGPAAAEATMIFLDAAATTPVRREVLEAMWPYLTGEFGNPSSHHSLGEAAAAALAGARAATAKALGCRAGEVVFTSGGTEADNLAVKGIALARRAADPRLDRVAISAVEHPAVEESARYLERVHGFAVDVIPVDRFGQVSEEALAAVLQPGTALVSIMYANNEVGTVQPIARLAALARAHGVPFHTDAVQAAGWLPLDTGALGVDALSISGHKLGAPKGSGALFVRGRVRLEPLVHGGGQERGRRSGTENVAGAVALATALALPREPAGRVAALRDGFIDGKDQPDQAAGQKNQSPSMNPSRRAATRPAGSRGERQRRGQRHGAGDVFRARPAAAFLPAAVDQRFKPDPAAHEQRAAALGRAQLVAGNAQRVHAQRAGVQRQPAGGLDGVGVERDSVRAGQRREPGDGLDRADLVVGVHDADQRPSRDRSTAARASSVTCP